MRSNGEIRWKGGLVFISTVLPGEAVGICEGDLGHDVYFGPVLLGRINVKGESSYVLKAVTVNLGVLPMRLANLLPLLVVAQ